MDDAFRIAAKHDVGTATGHIGGNGDRIGLAGLRDNLGFTRVLLGVQYLMRQFFRLEQLRQQFGIFNRGGAEQYRLAALKTVLHIHHDGVMFFLGSDVDQVVGVFADHRLVGRDDHGFQIVDLLEFEGLGVGRTGHAGQLAVEAEIILKGDRRQGL